VQSLSREWQQWLLRSPWLDRWFVRTDDDDVESGCEGAYCESLKRLASLVAQASVREWSPGLAACALSAVAAAKGQHVVAEAVLEMSSPEVAAEFLQWRFDQ
jgi:hypothetical protein